MSTHEIWVVERSKLFREGLKLLLKDSPFKVTAEVPLMRLVAESIDAQRKPAMILVALESVLEAGSQEQIELTSLCEMSGDIPVIVLSNAMSIAQLTSAMKAGVRAYLLKDISPDVLTQSLRLVMSGEKVLPSDLVTMLLDGREIHVKSSGPDAFPAELSSREKNILRCLAHGHANKLIANELNITEGTVKVHVKAVFRKIRARNRTEAAIWALNHGF